MSGRLVWIPDSNRARTPQFGGAAATIYVPADGEITVQVRGNGRSAAGECVIEGSKTFAIRELPPAALQYLQLDIAPDGRYKLMLGMISYFLQFQLEENCRAGRQRLRQTVTINDAAIVIGAQQGVVANDVVKGETAVPVVLGPNRYTGTWEFKSAAAE
jgi:hypothetical protein